MDILSSFLKKYRKIVKDDSDLKQNISSILEDQININIKPEFIEIKNQSIVIICSQAVKSQIFIKQISIIEAVNKKTGLNFKDLRF